MADQKHIVVISPIGVVVDELGDLIFAPGGLLYDIAFVHHNQLKAGLGVKDLDFVGDLSFKRFSVVSVIVIPAAIPEAEALHRELSGFELHKPRQVLALEGEGQVIVTAFGHFSQNLSLL
ncbi:MAG: hypothetical protein IJG87_02380 [Ruminococcus sp.]|nr:hypothetical protein [Ruminococcus sp.]